MRAFHPSAQAPLADQPLTIGRGAEWIRRGANQISLRRRGAVRRILRQLTACMREHPGTSLSVNELFEVGWPGEKAIPESAATQVYWAIATLRRLGLHGVVITRDEGYALDDVQKLFMKLA